MMLQLSYAVLLTSLFLFVLFIMFIDGFVSEPECQHENKMTYYSYRKQICIDCLREFQIEEEK